MKTQCGFTILLALALALALACPPAYGQMTVIPKYDPVVTLDPASPAAGATAHVTTHVSLFYYQQGKDPSVPDVYVKYAMEGPAGEVPLPASTAGYTDARGNHSADIKLPAAPGDYTLKVYVYDAPGGDVYGMGMARFAVKAAAGTPVPATSTPKPTQEVVPSTAPANPAPGSGGLKLDARVLLVAGAAIAAAILLLILVLAALAFLWTRKKLAVVAAKASAPADGESVIPVRVKFTNGLGMARRVEEDTTIMMSATAGTIGNVIISKGMDGADAGLRTSKEFGTVTITAKAGDKTATARVKFTGDDARLGFVLVPGSMPADGAPITIGVRAVGADGGVIAPLEDLTVDLKATQGKVTPRVIIKAKAPEASAEYNPGTVPGNATITATAGNLKGEVTLALKEKPGRFCMHCGAGVEPDAPACQKCGLTPPSGVDTKQCGACGTVIPEAAKFCHRCGLAQPELATPPVQPAGDAAATKK